MSLTFDGLSIPGLVEPWSPGEWNTMFQDYSQFGLIGGGTMFGGRTTRILSVPVWLYDGYSSFASLSSVIAAIEAKIGRTGSLLEESGASATYPLCNLRSVVRRGAVIPPNEDRGWSQMLTLNLMQMEP